MLLVARKKMSATEIDLDKYHPTCSNEATSCSVDSNQIVGKTQCCGNHVVIGLTPALTTPHKPSFLEQKR